MRVAPFDANDVRNECLFPLCNRRSQHSSVRFPLSSALFILSAAAVILMSPALSLPWSLSSSFGRCCQAYCRSIAVSYLTGTQVRSKQMSPLHQTQRTHTEQRQKERDSLGNNEWVLMLGNGCSVGGSHLSVYLFSCLLLTSVSSYIFG